VKFDHLLTSARIIWFAFSVATIAPLFAQPSAYKTQTPDELVRSVEGFRVQNQLNVSASQNQGGKCGLSLWFDIRQNWNSFSAAQKQQLQFLMTEPVRQKNRIVGRFRISYDTTGSDEPSLIDATFGRIPNTAEQFVDSAGEFFNHAWNYEIDLLGYATPPLNPDGTYHVVISDLSSGYYGITWPDSVQFTTGPPLRYSTYIEIDNDFSTVYRPTRGIPALEVTAAHEFHHAIQLGSYGTWDDDRYFYEITSVWMEDVVYDDVNDYYQYLSNSPFLSSQFSHPDIRFTEYNGSMEYSRGIWGKFIEKRFSRNVMKRTWEFMRQVSSIPALDNALAETGSSFKSAFLEYSYWNSLTGPNADTATYYTEGKHYPTMILQAERTYAAPGLSIIDSIQAISSIYEPIQVQTTKMLAIISNVNIPSEYSSQRFSFLYSLGEAASSGGKHLSNGLYAIINVGDPQNWSSQETVPSVVNDIVAYPNPFTPKGNKPIKFRLPQANQPTATLTVFSSSLIRFFSGELPIRIPKPFEPVLEWDAHDDANNMIPTGVYFFVIGVDGKEYIGKFSVIRE
jgi:hypothetical protein